MWSKHHNRWQIHGSLEFRPVIYPNTAGGHGYGAFVVEFEGGHKIEIWSPHTEIKGLMVGERAYNFNGTMKIKDQKNNLYCEVAFNINAKGALKSIISYGASFLPGTKQPQPDQLETSQRADYFEGVISKTPEIDYLKNRKTLKKGTDYLCDVNGTWTTDLFIDDKLFWHVDGHIGYRLRPIQKPLQSDCRFREDLLELAKGDEESGPVRPFYN